METVKQIEYNGALYDIQDAEAQKNLVYSQEETDTGKIWIDGKKIYRKVVNCGTLLNSAKKEVKHNIENIDEICFQYGKTYLLSQKVFLPLPYAYDSTGTIALSATREVINLTTFGNRTEAINTSVVLEYTKTTN